MRIIRVQIVARGALALAVATAPAVADAQDKAQTSGETTGEIVVTATKSKEAISKVPISIFALDARALQASGVKSIADLASIAPGVEFDQSAGFGPGTTTNIAIRGVNSPFGTSTTGVYIDDTPIQTRVSYLSYWGNPYPVTFDLDRIEVERGPQGTLFGAGAEGGAVRFISPEPSLSHFSGDAHAEVAATEKGAPSYEGGLAIGAPLVQDKLGLRASIWYRRDGGYVDRVNPFTDATVQRNADFHDSVAGRFALAFQPEAWIKLTPSIYVQSVHSNDSSAFYEALPNPPAGPAATGTAMPDSGVFQNGRLIAQPNTDKFILPSLKVEAELGGGLTLTSVTSYFKRKGTLTDDTTGVNGAFFGGYGYNGGDPAYFNLLTDPSNQGPEYLSTKVHSFSQEVRLANVPGSRVKFTVGFFYSSAHQTDTQNVYAPWTVNNVINPFILGGPVLDPNAPILTSQLTSLDKQVSAFGQLDAKLTPKLTFTLGGRISHVVSSYTQAQTGFLSAAAPGQTLVTGGKQTQSPWSGKAGLEYQIDPGTMVYASASRGFRVGGANQPISFANCGVQAPASYGSDYVNSYEAGSKGRLAGGALRFDVDGFYVKWKNVQQAVNLACQFGYVANLGDAHTRGFDATLRIKPTTDLSLNASVTYTDASFTRTVPFPTSTTGQVVVSSGDQISAYSSPWTVTGAAEYHFAAAGAKGTLRIEDIYHSRNNGQISSANPLNVAYNPALLVNPTTNMLNARLTLDVAKIELALFVNNLANSHPRLYRYVEGVGLAAGFTDTTFRPRTIGLSGDYRF